MEPLRIEFHLGSAIQMDSSPIHFDGLVAYALLQDRLTKGLSVDPANPADSIYTQMPLEHDGEVYKASVLKLQGLLGSETRFFTAKSGADEMVALQSEPETARLVQGAHRLNKINQDKGEFKNALVFCNTRQAKAAVAYCIGEKDELSRLFSEHITSIGKHRNRGFGRVLGVRVESDDNARDLWRARHFASPQPDCFEIRGASKAPYWNKEQSGVAYAHKSVY